MASASDVFSHRIPCADDTPTRLRVKAEIERLVGEYPVDVKGFRTDDKAWLKARDLRDDAQALRRDSPSDDHVPDWDYFQFVEIGLDRIHHGFWKYHDPAHRQYAPNSPTNCHHRTTTCYLDDEIGSLLELIDDDTIVLLRLRPRCSAPRRRILRQRVAAPRRTARPEAGTEEADAVSRRKWWTGAARASGARAATTRASSSTSRAVSPKASSRPTGTTISWPS